MENKAVSASQRERSGIERAVDELIRAGLLSADSATRAQEIIAKETKAAEMALALYRAHVLIHPDLFTEDQSHESEIEELYHTVEQGYLEALTRYAEETARECLDDKFYTVSMNAHWTLLNTKGIPDRTAIWERFVDRSPFDAMSFLESLPKSLRHEIPPESLTPLLAHEDRILRERALKQLANLQAETAIQEAEQSSSATLSQERRAQTCGRSR